MNRASFVIAAAGLAASGSVCAQEQAATAGLRAWGPPAIPVAGSHVRIVGHRTLEGAFTLAGADGGALAVRCDRQSLAAAVSQPGAVVIRGFPLDALRHVDLEVERFWVTHPA